MRYINLVNGNQPWRLDYEKIKFSDSQVLVNIEPTYLKNEEVTIKSRMSWEDIQVIMAIVADLRTKNVDKIHLYVPYFLGARSDRKFGEYSANYLKQVICPLINSLKFTSVTVMDPHSHCVEMGLNGFESISNESIVRFALNSIAKDNKETHDKLVWLIPDKGATDKAYSTIKTLGFKGDIIECSKKRDRNGNIVETHIPGEVIFDKNEPCIIVDDICDGGRTFIELAKVAKKRGAGPIYLCVTHGIFSKGFEELHEYFEKIYTTNSFRDFSGTNSQVLNVF